MVAYNFTIDDTSPMIEYSGKWSRKHPEDTKVDLYFSRNFAKTRTAGDFAQVRFNGSAIWAFGSKRESHGNFNATLDGTSVEDTGYQPAPGTIQAVLFSQTGLATGVEHLLTLTNTQQDAWFDVDYFIVQHEETQEAEELELQTVVVDTPTLEFFTYGGDWKLDYAGQEYHNSTGAMSYAAGETVEFSFTGTSVAVYGAVNSNHGVYAVTCDGVYTEYSGWYDGGITGGAVMFHRAGLDNVSHTVTMTNLGAKPTHFFGIDYVQYNYTVPRATVACDGCSTAVPTSTALVQAPSSSSVSVSVPASSSSTPSETSSTSSSSTSPGFTAPAVMGGADMGASRTSNGLSHGALAGIIIASVATVTAIALLIWFLIRRRNKDVTVYPWSDQRRLAGGSSVGEGLSPMALTGSPASPYQDVPFSGGRYPGRDAWPDNAPPNMVQRNPFATGPMLPLPNMPPPASNVTSYYPYAQSVAPPTEAGTPEETLSDTTRSTTDRAYSGMSPAYSPFHHTAPSSGAIPSDMGDPAEIRIASQAYSTRPNFQSLTSSHQPSSLSPYHASRMSRQNSTGSVTPSSSVSASFGRRKQGVQLPVTSTPPASTLSSDQLSQIRMIVEGRLQDWGPVSLHEEESNILPPDYSQATEPLPGQPGSDR